MRVQARLLLRYRRVSISRYTAAGDNLPALLTELLRLREAVRIAEEGTLEPSQEALTFRPF